MQKGTILFFFFLEILFIQQRWRQPAREGTQAGGVGEEKSRLIAEEPDVGLNPIMPGSHPELKADA